MVSPKLRLTDQFSDASTEHTCSFIFYWLFTGLLCQVLYQNRMWENRVKIDFHTIVMKHCISKFINSKMEKKHKNTPKGQKMCGIARNKSSEYGSATGVKWHCLAALSNGVVKRRCQTVLSNGVVKWQCKRRC